MSRSEDFLAELDKSGLDLKEQADAIAERMSSIRMQIDTHEAEAKQGEKPLDRAWRAKAKHALRMYGIAHQKVLKKCGELSRAERKNGSESYGQRFIAAAKRRLQSEVFTAIADEAEKP